LAVDQQNLLVRKKVVAVSGGFRHVATRLNAIFSTMFWAKREQKHERYYLLAGMGGRAMRRKHKLFLCWSILTGLAVSGALALGLYWFNRG